MQVDEGLLTDRVRVHVQSVCADLKAHLKRQSDCELWERLCVRSRADRFAKTALLADRLAQPGPPLDIAQDFGSRDFVQNSEELLPYHIFLSNNSSNNGVCAFCLANSQFAPKGEARR